MFKAALGTGFAPLERAINSYILVDALAVLQATMQNNPALGKDAG